MEVRKYPCLYDKSDGEYKERDMKAYVWRKVGDSLGYEEDKTFFVMSSQMFRARIQGGPIGLLCKARIIFKRLFNFLWWRLC